MADVRAFDRGLGGRPGKETAPPADSLISLDENFEEIFYRYGKPVLSFIRGMIGDRAIAEELTQETFIRAFQNIESRQAGARLSTWLFGIAHNVVREAVRQKYRSLRSVGLDRPEVGDFRDSQPPADDRMLVRELIGKVQAAMNALPEDHRVAFVLKMIHRLPYDEISAITGSSVGKLKTDLHRARIEMRRRLEPYLGQHYWRVRGQP